MHHRTPIRHVHVTRALRPPQNNHCNILKQDCGNSAVCRPDRSMPEFLDLPSTQAWEKPATLGMPSSLHHPHGLRGGVPTSVNARMVGSRFLEVPQRPTRGAVTTACEERRQGKWRQFRPSCRTAFRAAAPRQAPSNFTIAKFSSRLHNSGKPARGAVHPPA